MSSSSAPEKTFSSLVSHQYNIWPCSPTATAATYYSSKSFEAFASNDQKSRDEFPKQAKTGYYSAFFVVVAAGIYDGTICLSARLTFGDTKNKTEMG